MPLYLVRHAKAGSRSDFDGNDIDRPLTNSGHRQAEELAKRLAAVSPTLVVSSPYKRCIETVEPLAVAMDLQVTLDERLSEFGNDLVQPDVSLFDLLHSVPDHAVLCSHGDVIPAVVHALSNSGMRIDGTSEWGKGSVWILDRTDNRFVAARAWAPPPVD